MSTFHEILSLFAELASNLRPQDPTAPNEVHLSVSNLNRSLNLNEPPRVRILDTALSLMCFTAPRVYDSVIEFTLKTIVTVLSSSIECKVLRINQEQVLRVGGLISKSDCASVLEMCAGILGKFDGNKGDLCYLLIYNVFRVAALASCFPQAIPSESYGTKFDDSSSSLTKLAGHLPKELTFKNGEIPPRSLLWHLDPMILKQDISEFLRENIKRPFLSVRMELYDRIEWRSKIICLVISPTMFIETRAFLHHWFLMTGLSSVMELQTEIVGQVLDIISRPMWWGISMEVGSKLQFSHAYFPYEHHLLRILAGPISLENFQQLLHKICDQVSHVGDHLQTTSSRKTATKINVVDHKSIWAMVMNFPGWLSFASMMLFSNNGFPDNFYRRSVPGSDKHFVINGQEVTCPAGAAQFIAWILNPVSDSNQLLLVDYLVNVSDLWTQRYSNPNKYKRHKETRRLKLHDKDGINSNELDSSITSLWLKEFKDLYVKHFGTKVGYLLRRIPLGIMLLCPNHLNGEACSLLLHYAATGIIPEVSGQQFQKRQKHESCWESERWGEQCTKAEAIAGCKSVFDITDIAESICSSLFETDEEGAKFVCQVKLKACSYLLKCMKRLLQIKFDEEDGFQMQRDLHSRVLRWRNQVKDVNKDFDCVCDALNV